MILYTPNLTNLPRLRAATASLARLVNAPPVNPRAAVRLAVDGMRKGAVRG